MKKLIWCDLETTGLRPWNEDILEVCVVITDTNRVEQARFKSLVVPDQSIEAAGGWEAYVGQWDKYTLRTKKENGLYDELLSNLNEPAFFTKAVHERLRAFLKQHAYPEPRQNYLAGNSVNFDKGFLDYHMPIEDLVHYRLLDNTAFRLCLQAETGVDFEYPKKKTHRAEDDIVESMAELGFLFRRLTEWVRANDAGGGQKAGT